MFEALDSQFDIQSLDKVKMFLSGQMSQVNSSAGSESLPSLENGLGVEDISNIWQILALIKQVLILAATIAVEVLEIALWLIKGILNFLT